MNSAARTAIAAARTVAGVAAIVVGWVCAVGAGRIHLGLYPYSTSWVSIAALAAVFFALGLWLIRPIVHVTSARDLVDRPFLAPVVLAICGSILLAAAPSKTAIPITIVFLAYSLAAPVRLARRPRWGRGVLLLMCGWFVCFVVMAGVASSLAMDPDRALTVAVVPLIGFVLGMALSVAARLMRARVDMRG